MKYNKHIQRFNEHQENLNISDVSDSIKINENDGFGVVNIQIDGNGFIKQRVVEDIRRILSKYQGERHLFVDDKEINPYISHGGMG
jgi:hypothetical protein